MAEEETKKSGVIGSSLRLAGIAAMVAIPAVFLHKNIQPLMAAKTNWAGKVGQTGLSAVTGVTATNTKGQAAWRLIGTGAAAGAVIGGYNSITGQTHSRPIVGSHTARLESEPDYGLDRGGR